MSTQKRTYTKEFEQEALRLLETAESTASIERDLGITPGLLSRWNREQNQKGKDAFAGRGNVVGEVGEIQALKRKAALLEQERDILKKAVAIFAQVKG